MRTWIPAIVLSLLFAPALLSAQDRDVRGERLVLDDDGGGGTTNTMTIMADPSLAADVVLTIPDPGAGTAQFLLAPPGSSGAWLLGGNAGTTFGTDLLGTSDNVALQIGVNGGAGNSLILNTNWSIQRDNGGDARGFRAVDLQSARAASTQVASGNFSFIGAGGNSTASGDQAFIGAGAQNSATSLSSAVVAGFNNTVENQDAFIGGGASNTVSSTNAAIVAGVNNSIAAPAINGFIGAGTDNSITSQNSVIGGGTGNATSGNLSTIGGGQNNTITALLGTIGGGNGNTVGSNGGTVSGGQNNIAAFFAAVGGGRNNDASVSIATIGGGESNTARFGGTVGGGSFNFAGDYGAIPGGQGLRVLERSFGFLANDNTHPMEITTSYVSVFGNTNLWLANNDGTARQLRFYEAQATTGAFPAAGTNYTSFAAGAQSVDITYTLPTAQGAAGQVLHNDGSGNLSWAAAGTSGLVFNRVTTAGPTYNAASTDGIIGVDVSGGPVTVNLPAASTIASGCVMIVNVEAGDAGTNNVTINAAGGDTFDGTGATSLTISFAQGQFKFYSDGVNGWYTY